MSRLYYLITAALIIAAVLAVCGSNEGAKRLTIAVIPKGSTHEFWKTIHAGALDAAQEVGVDIIWKGPARALQDFGLAGKVVFVGFDSSDKLIEAPSIRELLKHTVKYEN